MFEHRAVDLAENILADVDQQVWRDAEDVRVVGRVMDLAKGEPVGDLGQAAVVVIGDDVSRVEEEDVAEVAHRAAAAVGTEDHLAEPMLM